MRDCPETNLVQLHGLARKGGSLALVVIRVKEQASGRVNPSAGLQCAPVAFPVTCWPRRW